MKTSPNFIGTAILSSAFEFNRSTRVFAAEISEVPAVLRQMFSDSMDLGFAMVSAKTGKLAYFTLVCAERDREGDMITWVFEPTPTSLWQNPGLDGVVVIVFND